MTRTLLAVFVALMLASALIAYAIGTLGVVSRQITRESRTLPSLVGVVGILFGLFIGFNSSDINQRTSSIQLATQRELSAARSLLNFASGIGPTAEPIRNAVVEYLQTITTTEREWLESGANGAAPGEAPVYSLALVTTLFAEQTKSTDVIKSIMMSRVDELINARTERVTRTIRRADVPLWALLVLIAAATQVLGAIALSGSRFQSVSFLAGYTLVAVVGLGYLAWLDRLIGPNRIAEQATQFEQLLARSATVERVAATGAINLGYRADQFPFSYEGAERKPAGYTLDLCHRIIELVQIQRGKAPALIKMVALNPGNRVAMVANGTVDMECDLSTDNPGREAQVAFLDPIFIGSTKIVVMANSGIAASSDLAGKRLVVVTGSSNMQIAAELNRERRLNMNIVPVKDSAEAIQMMESGTGDAFISSDILIYGLIARANQPGNYKVLEDALSKRTYGIMVRRQDVAFKDAANAALHGMVKSGEFETIYRRWFQSPIDPGGVNLNLPMSNALRERLGVTEGAR